MTTPAISRMQDAVFTEEAEPPRHEAPEKRAVGMPSAGVISRCCSHPLLLAREGTRRSLHIFTADSLGATPTEQCGRMAPLDRIPLILNSHGGLATRAQLLAAGATVRSVASAVNGQRAIRVRRAWYALPDTEPDRVAAVALGGRLGALSAAASYGIWRGRDVDLHVSWKPTGNVALPGRREFGYPGSPHLVNGSRIIAHWRTGEFGSSDLWRESVNQSLRQIWLSADPLTATCSSDSALNLGLISESEMDHLFAILPRRLRRHRATLDALADSGIETIVRLWLIAHGCTVRSQVSIGGHRVDFLVGRSLVIETDGAKFHSDDERFNRDRIRRAELQAHGYTVVQLSYRMIMFNWPLVEAILLLELARGRHMDPVI